MIYFICGNESRELKYLNVIEGIKKANINIEEYFFDVELKEESNFLEKVSINSIFSSNELIVLKRSEKIKNIYDTLKYICSLEIVNKEIVIDYNQEDGKIQPKLKKQLEELEKENKDNIKLFFYAETSTETLEKYVEKELKIEKKEAKKLLEVIGSNTYKVKNEIEKIKIFLLDEKYELEKVKKIICISKEYEIYEISNEIFENKYVEVLEYLEKSKEYMQVLYTLYSEIEIMLKICYLKNEGYKFSNNYNVFKEEFEKVKNVFKVNKRIPNPYVVYKKMDRLKNYSENSLKYLLYKGWEIERDIKIGKIDMNVGVENYIIEIVNCYKK